ncbi:MAG: metal ABC transporter permease [Gemmobacter sp.]
MILALAADYTVQTVAMGAALLGLVSGTVGAFAVLRGQSLLGAALSHATLPGICAGFLIAGGRHLESLFAGAFVSGLIAAGVAVAIAGRSRIKTDAALGLVLGLSFALGVVLLTHIQARGGAAQAGLESFLFGQAAAMLRGDLAVMAVLAAVALGLVAAFWKELTLVTFDPGFARVQGLPVAAVELGLTALIALAIVLGLQMVGVVLVTAMLIAPAAAARQWVRRLGPMVALSALFGVAAGVFGAVLSAAARGLATGPLIVLAATAIFAASILFAPERGLAARWLRRRAERRRVAGRRVLRSMQALAKEHGDPAYPAERGMIEALHGPGTRAALARLEAQGLVRPVPHRPESTPHWALTEAGRVQAEDRA